MHIQISQRNKDTGAKRTWTFIVDFDWEQFNFEDANNVLRFCRYNTQDKKGKPLKYYDITSKQYNCTWKQAAPSLKIQEKALAKFMQSWSVKVSKDKK